MEKVGSMLDYAGEENMHYRFSVVPSKIRPIAAYIVSTEVMLCSVQK